MRRAARPRAPESHPARLEPVASRSRDDSRALQEAADRVVDALGLIAEAERAVFDPVRADELTAELLAPDVPPSAVDRAERAVRRWLAAFDDEPSPTGCDSGDGEPPPDQPAA